MRLRIMWVLGLGLGLMACASGPSRQELQQQAMLAQGEQAEKAGNYDAALVQYVTALGEAPDNVEAHYRVGRVHRTLGNAAVAREAFQRALAGNPDHAGALEGLGLLSLEAGQHDLARALLHQAAGKDPALWATYNGLGVLADLEGKHKLAQSYFGWAQKLRNRDPVLINNLGYSYYLAGNLNEARRQFEVALSMDPENRKAWSNLSLVHTRQGQYARAVQTLERIMSPSEARYSVGYICMLEGKLDAAEALFKDSIKTSTSYNPATYAALKRVREERAAQARPEHPMF